jgi:hypothetical protein
MKLKNIYPFMLCLLLATACGKNLQEKPLVILEDPNSSPNGLIFQTGFEEGQRIIPFGATDSRLVGRDDSLKSLSDIAEREQSLSTGQFYFNYTGGDSTKRFAKIVADPSGLPNKVLHYQISSPFAAETGAEKARVQYEFYSLKNGLKSFQQSVRIFIPTHVNLLRSYPNKIDWLTIMEFWNNITWSQTVPNRFRVTLGIGKPTATESDLSFILDGQDCELFSDGKQTYTTLWAEKNDKVKVPIGQWFTLTYSYKEGNDKTGNFQMEIEINGVKQVVFDVKNYTHNSKDAYPDGVTHFNPMKLYTSKEVVNYLKSKGKTLDIYWDDLKIWRK